MMNMTDGPAPGGQETGAGPAPGPPPGKVTPTPGQTKEVNISTVCRIGQETVEEIVSRTQEVFSILKSLKPPVGSYSKMAAMEDQNNLEKQNRLNEVLKGIGMLFKRLRVCWDKCGENTSFRIQAVAISTRALVRSGRTRAIEFKTRLHFENVTSKAHWTIW